MSKVTDFEVLGAIAAEDGPIGCANYSNLLSLNMSKKGWEATFGLSHEFGEALFRDKSTCVLYVVDRVAFNAKKKELEGAE